MEKIFTPCYDICRHIVYSPLNWRLGKIHMILKIAIKLYILNKKLIKYFLSSLFSSDDSRRLIFYHFPKNTVWQQFFTICIFGRLAPIFFAWWKNFPFLEDINPPTVIIRCIIFDPRKKDPCGGGYGKSLCSHVKSYIKYQKFVWFSVWTKLLVLSFPENPALVRSPGSTRGIL